MFLLQPEEGLSFESRVARADYDKLCPNACITVDYLYWLDQIQPSERYLVGDKAFYLSQLAQQDSPVVPGFVVAAPALREFLENYDWREPLFAELLNSSLHLNVDDARQLQEIAQHIRQEIVAAEFPREWIGQLGSAGEMLRASVLIFRPSITLPSSAASYLEMSGLLECHVCLCDPEEIALAVLQTWAELFRARSLLYWQRCGVQLQQLNMGVLVQPVWEAIAAGKLIAKPTEFEIHSTWGLGMSLELGQVIPDLHRIDARTKELLHQQLGHKYLAYDFAFNDRQSEMVYPEMSLLSTYSCLQPYAVPEDRQQQFALDPSNLVRLIERADKVRGNYPTPFVLEWIVTARTEGWESQLYFRGADFGVSQIPMLAPGDRAPVAETSSPVEKTDAENMDEKIVGIGAGGGQAIAPAYVMGSKDTPPDAVPPGQILIAEAIAPGWLGVVRHAAGLVTERGGITSHAAILAREFGIPAAIAVPGITQRITTGDLVFLDGDTGEISLVTEDDSLEVKTDPKRRLSEAAQNIKLQPTPAPIDSQVKDLSSPPPLFEYPIATQLFVNLSHPSALDRIGALPLDGVGLLRSEMMALETFHSLPPSQWVHSDKTPAFIEKIATHLTQIAQLFFPRPVFYRSLDLRGAGEIAEESESTSASSRREQPLGLHGAFSYLLDPALFDLELAILARVQQAGYPNIRLVLPFVRTVEEFSFCRRRVERAGLTQVNEFELWMMAEVPSAVFLLPEYVKAGVQGISIGCNDLTQLLLAADRENQQMSAAFPAAHPAVMRAMRQLILAAKAAAIPCAVCMGASAASLEMVNDLVEWGITAISVESSAIEPTYRAIARAEKRLLLDAARQQRDNLNP